MSIKIVKSPTGSGKTESILNLSKEKNVLIAVPTVKLADEIYKRAVDKGIKADVILGRNNYVCGYKAKLSGIEINNKGERQLRFDNYGKQFRQDYVCCNRKTCEFDAYRYQIEKIKQTNPNLIITTHALLKNLSFTYERLPFEVEVVAIDEIHSFISSLKQPIPRWRIKVSDVLLLLNEILQESFTSQTKQQARLLKNKLERILRNSKQSSVKLVKIVDEKSFVKVFDEYSTKEFNELIIILEEGLSKIRESIKEKSKKAEKVSLITLLTETKATVENIKRVDTSGQYSFIRKTDNDIEIGVMQILFSPAFWRVFNRFMKSVEGLELIGTSATVPEEITRSMFRNRGYVFENKEFTFENSHVNLYVYDKDYSYEEKHKNLDVVVELTEKLIKVKPVVILTTSYLDIRYLNEKLKHYNLLVQKRDNSSEDLIEKFNTGDYSILIGNRGTWEGINIKKDCYFIFTKIPYFSPEDIDYQALEEYSSKNSFVINKKSAYLTLIQGLGRTIRDHNQTRTAFIVDGRFRDFGDVLKELPYSVDVAFFSDRHIKEIREIKTEPIQRDFLCLYTNSLVYVIKDKKIEKKVVSKIKESCRDLKESYEERYKRLCRKIAEVYIRTFKFFGTETDYDYIISQTGLSYAYIRKIEKEMEGGEDEV